MLLVAFGEEAEVGASALLVAGAFADGLDLDGGFGDGAVSELAGGGEAFDLGLEATEGRVAGGGELGSWLEVGEDALDGDAEQ